MNWGEGQRLLDNVKANCIECGDCWIWQGGSTKVPHISSGGTKRPVRKLVYEARGRKMVAGDFAGVTCTTPKCVAPAHVVSRSRVEHAKHHAALGSYSSIARAAKMALTKRAKSKLDDEKVRAIRASEKTGKQLSEEFGVAASYINSIRAGQLWKNYASPFAGLGAR